MTTYAIIGDGATGTTAAFYIRRTDPTGRITMFSEESTPAYYRAALTNYLMGELRAEQLFAVPPNFYEEFRVERTLTRIVDIDTEARQIGLSDGRRHPYDKLLIATGSKARQPSFPGAELGGVMTMRTMQDARFVMDQVQSGYLKHAVIVGGGILGLELVAGLRARGVGVTYVIRGNTFMPTVLDQVASDLVVSRCRHFGVDVRMDEEVQEAYGGPDGYFRAARMKTSGEIVEGQLMVVAIGITPNVDFLDGSGITVNRGVPVDDHMRTNVPNVFAGGDMVEVHDPWIDRMRGLGLWEPARHHGRIAGINMAGGSEIWRMGVPYNATRLYDLDLAGIGDSVGQPGDEFIVDFPETGRKIVYRKLVIRDNKLAGALLLGQRKERVRERGSKYKQLIASKVDVSEVKEMLLDTFFDLSSWMESLTTDGRGPDKTKAKSPPPRADVSKIMGWPDLSKRPAASPSQPGAAHAPTREEAAPPARRSLSTLMRSPVASSSGPPTPAPAGISQPTGPAPGVTAPTLRLQDGTLRPLESERITLGRSRGNDVAVADRSVSSEHAELRRNNGTFVITDLGSRNGTFVNEDAVAAPRNLAHGDVIRLGSTQMTFFNQVLPPRAETGPAGLPDEPLERPETTRGVVARITWEGGSEELTGAAVKIGRDPHETDVTLTDPAVSWLHAEITKHDDDLYLRDLGSRNGTFVNGELLSIPKALQKGDVIHIGNTDLRLDSPSEGTRPFEQAAPVAGRAQLDRPAGLLGTSGSVLGVWFALRQPSTTAGRDESSGIVLGDLTVSRSHADFRHDAGKWSITDTGSTNGTFVNDEQLEAGSVIMLKSGDSIRLGRLELRFDALPEGTTASSSAPADEMSETSDVARAPAGATTIMEVGELRRSRAPAASETSPPTQLAIRRGPRSGETIALTDLPLVIGREDDGDVVGLGDSYVSGRHLEIAATEDGSLQVSDLGSSNGTFIDDTPVTPHSPQPLVVGTKVRLGPVTLLEAE